MDLACKQFLAKAIRGTLALNIFFVLPLVCVLTANVPRIVEVVVRAPASSSISVGRDVSGKILYDRVKGVNASDAAQSVSVNLPCDFPIEEFVVSAKGVELVDVTARKNFMLLAHYDLNGDGDVYKCTKKGMCVISLTCAGILAAVILEMAIFLVAFGFAKMSGDVGKTDGVGLSVSVSILVASFFAIVVPLQSFLANRSLFKFPALYFVEEISILFLLSVAILFAGLQLSRKPFGYFVHSILLGMTSYEYLQSGVLSIGNPPIMGDISYYGNHALALRDNLILFGIMAIFTIGYKWLKPYLKWIVVALSIMIVASLFDIRHDQHSFGGKTSLSSGFCSKYDVAQSVVHSGNRNVIMFILDSVGTEAALAALKEDPELGCSFSGFTSFTNNIGAHQNTEYGLPALMTGHLYEREGTSSANGSQVDYISKPLGEESFIYDYCAAGVPTYFIPGSLMFGYSSELQKGSLSVETYTHDQSVFNYRPDTIPPLTLFETIRFRLAPFRAKRVILLMTFAGTKAHSSIKNESALFPILEMAEIDVARTNNLEVFHTFGAHGPFEVDRNGNALSVCRTDYKGHVDKTIYVLRQLARLLQKYRERGIYDKSFIVVTADHGWIGSKKYVEGSEELNERAPTLLWVKPIGASGEMKFTNVPTSHLKIKELMLAAREHDIPIDECAKILRAEHRVFRELLPGGHYKEWVVDESGTAAYKGVK